MGSPGKLGLAWAWEQGWLLQEEPWELSPSFWQLQPAWLPRAAKVAEQAPGLSLLLPTCPKCLEVSWHCPAGQKVKGRTCFPILIPRG